MRTPFSKTPEQVLCEAIAREAERQARRLLLADKPPDSRIRLLAQWPGHLSWGLVVGSRPREMSFFRALRVLDGLKDFSGSDATRDALDAAARNGAGTFPRDCPSHLQVGDTIGGQVVGMIRKGRDYDHAKTGQDVPYLRRKDLDETVVVGLGDSWRRGSQLPASFRDAGFAPRAEIPRLRALHREARQALSNEVWKVRRGLPFDRDRVLDLSLMATAARRALDVSGKPAQSEEKAEMAFLRLRQRDLGHLMDAVVRRSSLSPAFGSTSDERMLEWAVGNERRANRTRIDALHAVLDARRVLAREESPAPAPCPR